MSPEEQFPSFPWLPVRRLRRRLRTLALALFVPAGLWAISRGRVLEGAGPVIVSEIAAAGDTGVLDEDGESPDWLELLNVSTAAVELGGWALTDDPGHQALWRFPARSLGPGERVIVFASGKDRVSPRGELHASFKLSSEGEYLGLLDPAGGVSDELSPAYPPQAEGFTFGWSEESLEPALVSRGAAARVLIPRDASAGNAWKGGLEPFDDGPGSGWIQGRTGIGFDLGPPAVAPLFYYTFDDSSDPEVAIDGAPGQSHGRLTSHRQRFGSGGSLAPVYTPDGGGHTGLPGDRAVDFGARGEGGMVVVDDAAAGLFDSATQHDAVTISLWIKGSPDQPANDVVFWGSSEPDGTGIRSLNAHVPWSDRVVYWDTAGCCDGSQRVQKPEPDASLWMGAWNHWVFVKDGDTKRIYANGTLFLEGANTANLTTVRGFFLGCAPNNGEMTYGGLMDEVAVWDVALSEEQVQALALGASPLGLSSYKPYISTDTSLFQLGVSSTAYVRVPFDAPPVLEASALLLSVRYADGFVAYLNGVEVARRNAPAVPGFDSSATSSRPREEGLQVETLELPGGLSLLRAGRNLLAFHLLNDAPDSPDLLLLPELRAVQRSPGRVLASPTPGLPNGPGYLGIVGAPRASVERGLFSEAFAVMLSTPTDGAEVLYTLDGTEPTPGAPSTRQAGEPIPVTRATTLRARAFLAGHLPSPLVTHTYLFPSQVASQPARPPGLPGIWSGGFVADYGMDPDVIRAALPGYSLEEALRSLPSVALTLDPADLWSPAGGIYTNAEQVLERPGAIELLPAVGEQGFASGAGVRIHGNTSRLHSFTPKHSFRVTFKRRYGNSKLRARVFPDTAVDRFDQLVLRGMSTDSWCVMDGWAGPEPGTQRWFREQALYLREQWMKDSQLDLGQLAPHAQFVHLYLNGLYWGVYHLTERPTDSFHAEHLGGAREEYDVLKDFAEVQSGNGAAWQELMSLASAGLGSRAAYERLQGNRADGTRDPALERLLDVGNLIDYMILHIYASADDWPNHNWWGGRRRGPDSAGFRFYAWDQEITHISLDYVHTSWGPRYEEAGAFNSPSYLLQQLRANPELRVRFGDRVQALLFGSGALTPEASAARLERRAAEIDRAIVAESARWGDSKRSVPFKREVEWLAELARLTGDYWPRLHPIALERFRRVGLYPQVEPPRLEPPGGTITPGARLVIAPTTGTAYYTLDGTDPRLAGGAVAPGALRADGSEISLPGTTRVRARSLSGGAWSALGEGLYSVDLPLRITEIQYHPSAPPAGFPASNGEDELLELENVGTEALALDGFKLLGGVRFEFSTGRVRVLDPGALVVVVKNEAAFRARYPGVQALVAGEYSGELSNAGERLLLEGPRGEVVLDFRYSDLWYPVTDGGGPSLVVRDPNAPPSAWSAAAGWAASAYPLGSPGVNEVRGPVGRRLPGDMSGNGALDLTDAVRLLTRLFVDGSTALPCPGELEDAPNLQILDANGDRKIDLADAVSVLAYLFLGGLPPVGGVECLVVPGCGDACTR